LPWRVMSLRPSASHAAPLHDALPLSAGRLNAARSPKGLADAELVRVTLDILMPPLVVGMIMRAGLGHHALHFGDGQLWQELEEQQEEGEEHAERPDVGPPVHPCRAVVTPRTGDEVSMQAAHDHEALEPHADVDEDCEDEGDQQVAADFPEPEELGCDDVTDDHRAVSPPEFTQGAIPERVTFVNVAAVPCDEKFHRVGVAHHGSREKHELVHVLDVV